MLHQPSRFVAHTEMAHHLQCRNIVLGLRQQVHCQKPTAQRQLGGLKDGSGDQARLLPAAMTLLVLPAFTIEQTVSLIPAMWALPASAARRWIEGHSPRLGVAIFGKRPRNCPQGLDSRRCVNEASIAMVFPYKKTLNEFHQTQQAHRHHRRAERRGENDFCTRVFADRCRLPQFCECRFNRRRVVAFRA